jgi:hypothetical protein
VARSLDRHTRRSSTCSPTTCTDIASAGLDIVEIAHRYSGVLHGIGRRTGSPDEEDGAA